MFCRSWECERHRVGNLLTRSILFCYNKFSTYLMPTLFQEKQQASLQFWNMRCTRTIWSRHSWVTWWLGYYISQSSPKIYSGVFTLGSVASHLLLRALGIDLCWNIIIQRALAKWNKFTALLLFILKIYLNCLSWKY